MDPCARCRQAKRYDESLTHMQFSTEGGLAAGLVCPRCFTEILGLGSPTPKRYLPGCKMPLHPRRHPSLGEHLPVCGLCRLALFEDDFTRPVRVRTEDFLGQDVGMDIEDLGVYLLCRECREKAELSVRRRLFDLRFLPDWPPRQLNGLANVHEDMML